LDLGVDIHVCDSNGNNALMNLIINRGEFANLYAKDYGLIYIDVLLSKGIDRQHRNKAGFTAFDLAEQDDASRELLLFDDSLLIKSAME
jgi:hypothetical protein